MHYCKNCKYFKGKVDDINDCNGNCSCDKFKEGYSDISYMDISEKTIINEVLVEGGCWGFVVGEEFGCVHFINKKQ